MSTFNNKKIKKKVKKPVNGTPYAVAITTFTRRYSFDVMLNFYSDKQLIQIQTL